MFKWVLEKLHKKLNCIFSFFDFRFKIRQKYRLAERTSVRDELSTCIERAKAHARDKYTRNRKDFETDDGSHSLSQSHFNHQLGYTWTDVRARFSHTNRFTFLQAGESWSAWKDFMFFYGYHFVSFREKYLIFSNLPITTFDLDWHLIAINVAYGFYPLVNWTISIDVCQHLPLLEILIFHLIRHSYHSDFRIFIHARALTRKPSCAKMREIFLTQVSYQT